MIPPLIIAGIEIPFIAGGGVAQAYEPIAAQVTHRMATGSAFRQSLWRKVKTSISGDGWMPAALDGVDWTQEIEIACIQPVALASISNSLALPAARRSDAEVTAFALVAGELKSTPCNVVGDVATADAVPGASQYQFHYYPLLTCYSDGPRERIDAAQAVYGWELEAEEI